MISNRRSETLSGILVLTFVLFSVSGFNIQEALAAFTRKPSGELTEGLLVEARATQGGNVIGGKVLIEAGRGEWTTVAAIGATTGGIAKSKTSAPLKLEARAVMLEPDLVEVETRVTGGREESGKLVVRIGETGLITTSQMENSDAGSAAGANSAASKAGDSTSIGVKVLRVRYSL